jgi:hypothetical protein
VDQDSREDANHHRLCEFPHNSFLNEKEAAKCNASLKILRDSLGSLEWKTSSSAELGRLNRRALSAHSLIPEHPTS